MLGQTVKKSIIKRMEFSSCINHHKGRSKIATVSGIFFVLLTLWMAWFHPVRVHAAERTVNVKANNIQEMNKALGGNHKIKGNRLILQSNVTLDTKCDVSIQSTKPFDMILDMNGKTIRNKKGIFFEAMSLDRGKNDKWMFTITGTGKLVSDDVIFDDFYAYGKIDLVLAGNIDYHSSEGMFHLHGVITMQKGTLCRPAKNRHITIDTYGADFVMQGGKIEGTMEVASNMEMTGGTIDEILGAHDGVPRMTMRGGAVKGKVIECSLFMYGGTIGSFVAGIEGGIGLNLHGGTIKEGVTLDDECGMKMTGGTVKGKGVDLAGEFTEMKMTGGKIIADDSIAVKCRYRAKFRFGGGTIAISKKGAVGIYADAVSRVVLLNGTIKHKQNKGKYAVQLTQKNADDTSCVNLYMKGEKGQKVHITGFQYGLKRNKASKISEYS